MSNGQAVKEVEQFVEFFEREIEKKLKERGISNLIWVSQPEVDFGATVKGNCASQSHCGADRCKPLADDCATRVCVKRHSCGVNCQVGGDCAVYYCHGQSIG